MDDLLKKLTKLKEELDNYRPLPKETMNRIEQKMRLEWNYNSNAIEGNSLTLGETRALILHGITAKGKPMKDHLDVQGHNEAIRALEEVVKNDIPLTQAFIRELHQIVLKEPYSVDVLTEEGLPAKKEIKIGQYKTTPNNVKTSTGEIFYFATPEETPAKMDDLMKWYKDQEEKKEHPLLIAAGFHYRFVRIHPFDDGNGRMARILMNLILMKHGYPPAIIRMTLREEYLQALETADKTESLTEFITFIGESLAASLNLMLKAAKGEPFEDEDDLDKEISIFKAGIDTSKEFQMLNKELLEKIFTANLEPLMVRFADKVSKLKDMFVAAKTNASFSGKGGSLTTLTKVTEENIREAFEKFIKNSKQIMNFKLSIQCSLEGFKHEKEPQDYNLSFSAELDQYGYLIRFNGPKVSYKYPEIGDINELYKLLDDMFKGLLDTLKKKTETTE